MSVSNQKLSGKMTTWAEEYVDGILADLQRTVGSTVMDFLDMSVDRFTIQTFQHTHMFPYELDDVIDRAIKEVYVPVELDIGAWNEICDIIRHALPVGLLCMAHRLASDEVAGWTVVDVMNICMRRIRTSALPQRLVNSLVN